MAEDSDGVGEAFDDSLRTALTVASQIGERLARVREQTARDREAARAQQARELTNRFEAERAAARAQLAPVLDPNWWDTAGPQDIGDMHQTATEWRDHDTAARQAADRIRTEVRERYGVDIDRPAAEAATVAEQIAQTQIAQTQHDQAEDRERARGADDAATARRLLEQADRADRAAQDPREDEHRSLPEGSAAETAAIPGWDSAERREQFSTELQNRGIPAETITARILADGENATHPREAVATAATRRGRGLRLPGTQRQQRERDGQTR